MAMKSNETAEKSNEDGLVADAPDVAEGVTRAATVDKRPARTKAYRSDRNLAEFNADEVVYLDPNSDLGKRLIATGYLEEVEDPHGE